VNTALYIALIVLVGGAVAMQVWMLRTAAGSVPESRRPLLTFLRVLNIALLVFAAGVVVYALAVR